MAQSKPYHRFGDVLIHVNADVSNHDEELILGALHKIDGVVSAGFNTHHLMVVQYDPKEVSARRLLTTVKGKGYQSQLIGI